MDFVLWACRSLHIFSSVVWFGGLFFQGVVNAPILLAERMEFNELDRKVHSRFMPFVWTSVWTLVVTGFIMMLLNPRFEWFDYSTPWSRFLLGKQLCFAAMIALTVSSERAWRRTRALNIGEPGSDSAVRIDIARRRFVRLNRGSIALAILALLLIAGLDVY